MCINPIAHTSSTMIKSKLNVKRVRAKLSTDQFRLAEPCIVPVPIAATAS